MSEIPMYPNEDDDADDLRTAERMMLKARKDRDEALARIAELEALFQQTHGVHVSWVARVQELESALRQIQRWDMINPPYPGVLADAVWLKKLVDGALTPTPSVSTPAAEKPCPFDTPCFFCKTEIGVSRNENGKAYCDEHHPRPSEAFHGHSFGHGGPCTNGCGVDSEGFEDHGMFCTGPQRTNEAKAETPERKALWRVRKLLLHNCSSAALSEVELFLDNPPQTNEACPHPENEVTTHGLSSGGRMLSWCALCGARKLWNHATSSYRRDEGAWEVPLVPRTETPRVNCLSCKRPFPTSHPEFMMQCQCNGGFLLVPMSSGTGSAETPLVDPWNRACPRCGDNYISMPEAKAMDAYVEKRVQSVKLDEAQLRSDERVFTLDRIWTWLDQNGYPEAAKASFEVRERFFWPEKHEDVVTGSTP